MWFQLERDLPLGDQIYGQLRAGILEGRLRAGQRLPSTRLLARELDVSRNTAVLALERLAAEGYLEARAGSGTFVSTGLRLAPLPGNVEPGATLSLAPWTDEMAETDAEFEKEPLPYDFRSSGPSVERFPFPIWRKLTSAFWQGVTPGDLDYQHPAGRPELQRAIADHLALNRGVTADPRQIIIVHGAQQALDLLARILIRPGDSVIMESPGYAGAGLTFRAAGAAIVNARVDRMGLNPENIVGTPRLVYVTPSHQYPTGSVMPLPRRLRLLQEARARGFFVLEDDYNAEFRFQGRPIPALQGLAPGGPVIYIGTFSKSLFPAVRVGYIVAPQSLVQTVTRAKWLLDQHVAPDIQAVLAAFMAGGHYDRHIHRMRSVYREKAHRLIGVLQGAADRLELRPPPSGLHLFLPLHQDVDGKKLVNALQENGVGVLLHPWSEGEGIMVGFGRLGIREIDEGGQRLVTVLKGLF